MDREAWNQRYLSSDLVWGAAPNAFVAEAFADRPAAGRLLDLACGEGRNAIWLAGLGWRVTAIDLSDVAIDRARGLASREGVEVEWTLADVTKAELEPAAYAAVVISYLQIPGDQRRQVIEKAAAALAPGGRLFMIGHALRNLADGFGGPSSPAVLWAPGDLEEEVLAASLELERCAEVIRVVESDGETREAIDLLVDAHRAR